MTIPRGVIHIHSTPSALVQHIEWAVGSILGATVRMDWSAQPAEPGSYRAELSWRAPVGTGAKLASAFNRWQRLRYEVTEEFSAQDEGHRWSVTPSLGIFHASTGPHGDIMISEDRIKAALLAETLGREPVQVGLARLLGQPWDDELEPFRHSDESGSVRWLHQVV